METIFEYKLTIRCLKSVEAKVDVKIISNYCHSFMDWQTVVVLVILNLYFLLLKSFLAINKSQDTTDLGSVSWARY